MRKPITNAERTHNLTHSPADYNMRCPWCQERRRLREASHQRYLLRIA